MRFDLDIQWCKDFAIEVLSSRLHLDFAEFAATVHPKKNLAEIEVEDIAAESLGVEIVVADNSAQVDSKTAPDHSRAEFAHSKAAQQIADFVEFANFAELVDSRRSNSADFAHPPHKDFDYNLVDSYYL